MLAVSASVLAVVIFGNRFDPGKPIVLLYLVRHGQVLKTRPRSYNGQRDVPLSPSGLQQMERLAEWAAGLNLSAIYSSDLQRTVRGADLIAQRCGVPCVTSGALREKSFGEWEGLTYDEAEQHDPGTWAIWITDPSRARPPGGETYEEVRARVLPVLQQLVRDHQGETVLLLAHGGVNRVILCDALKLSLQRVFRIEQDYAALNIIEYAHNQAYVRLLNGAVPGDPLAAWADS